jgi:hypothetical protein
MSATLQTIIALTIVALAAALLLRSWFGKKKSPGCGSESCGAVSPEIRKLRSKIKG